MACQYFKVSVYLSENFSNHSNQRGEIFSAKMLRRRHANSINEKQHPSLLHTLIFFSFAKPRFVSSQIMDKCCICIWIMLKF